MAQSIDTLAAEIGRTVSRILKTDIALLRGYSQAKARAIARFTTLIGEARAAGTLDAGQMKAEMEELERMVVRFVRNIRALATTAAESVLAGLARLLLDRLRALTGIVDLGALIPAGSIWGLGGA